MMTYETLRYERENRIGVMTFAMPDMLNSLTEQRFAEIEAVLDIVESDPDLGAFIITGEGKGFCVGLDLSLLERAFDDIGYFESTIHRLNRILLRLEALPVPTIAAVNGFARAGGFEITLGCDFMIIANEAKIGDVHTDAGVVPACVTLRLNRRVGEQKAKDLLWTARWLKGSEAVAFGLALKSVPLANLVDEAKAFAASMADKPRPAIASLKKLFQEGSNLSVADGAELEMKSFVRYMSSEPYGREGYYAFREKRVPSWKTSA